jgi:negative regulator of replication initiation
MTDQLFQTANPQNNQPNNPSTMPQGQISSNTSDSNTYQNTITQQVQQLNDQQQQIQDKYKQLKELYQNNELTVEQKQQVQEQMQRLSDLYTQNKQTLAMLATNIS